MDEWEWVDGSGWAGGEDLGELGTDALETWVGRGERESGIDDHAARFGGADNVRFYSEVEGLAHGQAGPSTSE